MIYSNCDIALIVPTKDRPHKINSLLKSLVHLKNVPGRVIIVDGGKTVEHIVLKFSNSLPVEYYQCSPPSLIKQRNFGISKLNQSTPLVGFIDDDIVFDKDALPQMIDFWNRTTEKTAAVSFNIVNVPKDRCTFLNRLFFLSDTTPGRVLKSGVTTTYHNFDHNIKTQWVCGGATVWRLDIIKSIPQQQDIPSRWAVCEDLIYCYPVGKTHDFFLCSAARVRHEHDHDYVKPDAVYRYIGYNEVLWRLYFVMQTEDMSRVAWMLYAIGRSLSNILCSIKQMDLQFLKKATGNLAGLGHGLLTMIRKNDLKDLLDEG